MFGSISLFLCGVGLAFSVSLAYDNYLENKVLKERLKRYEENTIVTDEDINKIREDSKLINDSILKDNNV